MTHNKIDEAVNNAINQGIVVVAAAGNSGPDKSTIGSPARNSNAITVGATYNNRDSSIVSTLEVGRNTISGIANAWNRYNFRSNIN